MLQNDKNPLRQDEQNIEGPDEVMLPGAMGTLRVPRVIRVERETS